MFFDSIKSPSINRLRLAKPRNRDAIGMLSTNFDHAINQVIDLCMLAIARVYSVSLRTVIEVTPDPHVSVPVNTYTSLHCSATAK